MQNNGGNKIGLITFLVLVCLACFAIGFLMPIIAFLLRIIGAVALAALLAVVFVAVKNKMDKE